MIDANLDGVLWRAEERCGELRTALAHRRALLDSHRQRAARFEARIQAADRTEPLRKVCSACGRSLHLAHTFVSSDLCFCGSCAPRMSTPLVPQLTPESSGPSPWAALARFLNAETG